MRPFQIIVISIFAVLAIGGLFFFATFGGFGGGKSVGSVVIWGTLPAKTMTDALGHLVQGHQEYSKVTYVEKDPATFDADLADALASGTGPDMILTNQERLLSEESKLSVIPFSTLPERTYRDSYLPISEIYLTSTGTYGVPLAVDPLVLYYNRATLASANVPTVPTTWEAVLGLAPRLTVKTDAGIISKSAIALGTYSNIGNARAIISLLLLQAGTTITAGTQAGLRSTLASGNASSATAQLPADSAISFYTQFADPAKTVYTWNRSIPDARQSFISGDSAFYIGYASERAGIAAANPNLDFDMAAIPQPQTASGQSDYGLAYAFAITKASRNQQGDYRAAAALSAADEDVFIADSLGMAPAVRAKLVPAANDPYAAVFYPSALASKAWLSPSAETTDRIFAAMINSIISGQQTVHDAVVSADQSLTAAL